MHGFEELKSNGGSRTVGPWYREMNRYHWFVLTVAALGWLFDCLDQQLFVLARPAAMRELIPASQYPDAKALETARSVAGDYATSIFMVGWAMGGLFFGVLGDRIGRAKTMLITILLYSLFTGLSSLSQGPWDFAFYRFLTGLGVGGEFAVGVALVAEVMPNSARPLALGLLQALSAIGNISAALINLGLGIAQEGQTNSIPWIRDSPWRVMFMIGALPALLALLIRWRLKEPERWTKAAHDSTVDRQLGSYRALFASPVLRKHAILGLILGCSGIIGLWSVGFFTMDLIRFVQRPGVTAAVHDAELAKAEASNDTARVGRLRELSAAASNPQSTASQSAETKALAVELEGKVSGRLAQWSSYAAMAINIGAFFGMFGFGALSERIGRKPTFRIALISAFVTTVAVFWMLQDFWQIWVMVPIMGFCQLSLFAGYAIYFPELFPTHLRSTGTSFCYNVGRFVAAFGPIVKAALTRAFSDYPQPLPLRYAGMTMCTVFLMGLFVLPFLPETRGKNLPE